MSFGQGRFCEHEEEDISGEFDFWLIVVEWLFPSPYFYFCSDMPRDPLCSRRLQTNVYCPPRAQAQDIRGTQHPEGS